MYNNKNQQHLKPYKIVILFILGLSSCSQAPTVEVQVSQCATAPYPLAAAAATSLGDYAYIFAGRSTDGKATANLLRYEASTDQWKDMGATPLHPRVNAAICSDNENLYLGLGFDGYIYTDTAYLRDFWRYSPDKNTFERLADFPTDASDKPVLLYHENRIYAFFGFSWGRGFNTDIYVYDTEADSWQQVSPKGELPPRAAAATGAVADGRLFLGTGYRKGSKNFWYEYLPQEQQWEKRASAPGKGRHNAASAVSNGDIYMFGGWHYGDTLTTGFYFDDMIRYSAKDNRWQACGTMPQGKAENMVAFSIDDRIYFGLGENPQGIPQNLLYCIED